MSEWQPIETAPKDGREVIVWFEWERGNPKMPRGALFKAQWQYPDDMPEGWYDPDDGDPVGSDPTHWMPLPEPPKT